MSITLMILEIRIRSFFTITKDYLRSFFVGIKDYLRYIIEEIRNEGKDDDEWVLVQMQPPRSKLGSRK